MISTADSASGVGRSPENRKVSVLMVCLGNICRSPTAHGVFQKFIENQGIAHLVEVDSAGTAAYHIGEAPDPRSAAAALRRGYDLSVQRARQLRNEDFQDFDYLLAMDEANLAGILSRRPDSSTSEIQLFLDYGSTEVRAVPDPYYSGDEGFELVLNLVEQACEDLLRQLRLRHFSN